MKILHVNKLYSPWIGGVEKVAEQLAQGLGGEVLVCQSKGKRSVESVGGVRVTRAASWKVIWGMPISLDFFMLFKRKVRSADLIFLHHPFPLGFLAYVLWGRGKRLAVWYHSDIVRQKVTGLLFRPFLRYVLKKADCIFTASDNLKKYSLSLKGLQEKVHVVPFGIDLDYFSPTPAILEKVKEIKRRYRDQPLVLSVGRLIYYKGFEYLVQAMREVDAHLLIIGKGREGERLRKIVHELQLDEKITVIPHVDDLRPYYAATDIFVLPSVASSEAFGIVQVEAMAFSVPVVNTSLPTGVPEVSRDGETGITVTPKDAHALANALNYLLEKGELRERYGKSARQRAEEIFDEKVFIEKVLKKLQATFSLRKGRPFM